MVTKKTYRVPFIMNVMVWMDGPAVMLLEADPPAPHCLEVANMLKDDLRDRKMGLIQSIGTENF